MSSQPSRPTPPSVSSDNGLSESSARADFVLELAAQLGLMILSEKDVHHNWQVLATIAQSLMEHPLPPDSEPAQRFEP